ncbi:SCO family protein [Terrimonas pollutisoli]|uniref:SCO family protein n=1 Tax=Terrimonas pollutisoli TaxID=3034147 RepID=UPI0023EAB9C4|nr:SCO family protein [Terrimonas sp. H1YJ31]
MQKRSTIALFITAVFVLPFSAWALLNFYEKEFEALPVIGKAKDHHIGNFQLVNQDGIVKTEKQWDGKIVVADFFFTHCPTICPKMTASMMRINEEFKNDGAIWLSSFSVDPERDSATQLKTHADRFGIVTAKWDLLTGDKREIYKLARNSFMIVATDGDGGPNDFIHSEKLVLIDPQKRIRGYYDGTSDKEVKQLVNDIKKLKHEL